MRSLLIPILTITLLSPGAALAQQAGAQETGAQAAGAQETGVFRETDERLSCGRISDEAAQLGQAMGDATPEGGWLSSLGGIARSGAAMLLPGGGLAMAGVDAVRQPTRDRDQAEQAAVQNRWYYLNGLHIGRGCREQAQAPARSPAIQPGALPVPARSDR